MTFATARRSPNVAVVLLAGAALTATAPARALAQTPGATAVSPAAAPAVAPRTPFTLAIDTQSVAHRDRAYRLLSRDDSHAAGGLSLTYDVLCIKERGVLAVGLGGLSESTRGLWATSNESYLVVDTVYATVLGRYALRPWFEPYVRVSVGVARGRLDLADSNGTSLFEGRASAALVSLGGGFRVRTRPWTSLMYPQLPTVALFAALEGGFTSSGGLSFSGHAAPPAQAAAPTDQIPGPSVALGTLARSHPVVAFSLGLLF